MQICFINTQAFMCFTFVLHLASYVFIMYPVSQLPIMTVFFFVVARFSSILLWYFQQEFCFILPLLFVLSFSSHIISFAPCDKSFYYLCRQLWRYFWYFIYICLSLNNNIVSPLAFHLPLFYSNCMSWIRWWSKCIPCMCYNLIHKYGNIFKG